MAEGDIDFECFERAKDKLRVIDRFFRRQVGKRDVQEWVLPACKTAFLTPGYKKTAIHKAVMSFASALRDLPAEHAAGTNLVSVEGREALGALLLSEAYTEASQHAQQAAANVVKMDPCTSTPLNSGGALLRKDSLDGAAAAAVPDQAPTAGRRAPQMPAKRTHKSERQEIHDEAQYKPKMARVQHEEQQHTRTARPQRKSAQDAPLKWSDALPAQSCNPGMHTQHAALLEQLLAGGQQHCSSSGSVKASHDGKPKHKFDNEENSGQKQARHGAVHIVKTAAVASKEGCGHTDRYRACERHADLLAGVGAGSVQGLTGADENSRRPQRHTARLGQLASLTWGARRRKKIPDSEGSSTGGELQPRTGAASVPSTPRKKRDRSVTRAACRGDGAVAQDTTQKEAPKYATRHSLCIQKRPDDKAQTDARQEQADGEC